jgi:hypothetical protein
VPLGERLVGPDGEARFRRNETLSAPSVMRLRSKVSAFSRCMLGPNRGAATQPLGFEPAMGHGPAFPDWLVEPAILLFGSGAS